MERIWHEYLTVGIFHMCSQLIVNHLLQHHPLFLRNDKQIDVGHEFRDTYNTYWKTFIKDCIDQIFALGFVTVELVSDNANRTYPKCVHPSLFSIQYDYNTKEYRVMNKEAFVYGGYGYDPVKGRIMSLAVKVLPKLRYLRSLRESSRMMELQKEQPCYYAETDLYKPEQTGVASYIDYDDLDYNQYMPDNENQEQDEQIRNAIDKEREVRSRRQVELFEEQQRIYDESREHSARKKRGLKNVIPMPIGQKLVKVPLPTGRPDIVQLHKVIQEEVCSTLGVPRSLMIGDSMYRSDTAGVEELFRHTLLWWKATIQDICTDIYQQLYFDASKVKVAKNIYSAKKRYRVELNIQLSPFIDLDQLTFMYRSGIITWEDYSRAVLQKTHMPVKILPEPVQEAQRDQPEVPKKRQRISRQRLEDGT